MRIRWIVLLLSPAVVSAAELKLDETPARDSEWGYRPAPGTVSPVNPPAFCWRPQGEIIGWELECGRGDDFRSIEYRAEGIQYNVHTPPRTFPAGKYVWRYRGLDPQQRTTNWSRARSFTIAADAAPMPMPPREELMRRIPQSHPRLFLRPEDLPRLRDLARGPLRDRYRQLVARCERLLENPPPTEEPPKYPPGTVRLSEAWRKIWWGNRVYTVAALDGAATLAFTRLLGGKEEYGLLARRILMDCARWDPKGATGYRYNDEAGMPYAYHFARTYTFVDDLLTPEQRETCRRVMRVRGQEMYAHLCPRHLWRPYASHSNRAWHFLGEVGIAFLDEIEEADQWAWFAANVFLNVYPVWCDDDGGWHEGASYWNSYVSRFTWWADVMRAAMNIDAYQKPYFSQAGYYAMYMMPPGKVGGGFGDLAAERRASRNVPLVSQLAAQSGNGHWRWYVEQMGGPSEVGGYVGFLRGALPKVQPVPPRELPTSRLFRGTGQACLNSSLHDARHSVQVIFKSSPFGLQSHGYEANNSFLLWAYGQRLLVRSGRRDIHGSEHHRRWMWSTRSVNNILVDGQGQVPHSASTKGRILAFRTTPSLDVVVGEAGTAYRDKQADADDGRVLNEFTRAIIFFKPELLVVYDRLKATRPCTFQYLLHAPEKFEVADQGRIRLRVEDVGCAISLLAPEGLRFAQTDQYDPNPRPRVKLREWHLTASTPDKAGGVEFVALYRPHRLGEEPPAEAKLERVRDGYDLTARLSSTQTAQLHLPVTAGGLVVKRLGADGSAAAAVELTLD